MGIAEIRVGEAVALNRGHCTLLPDKVSIVTDPTSGGYSALIPVTPNESYRGAALLQCDLELHRGLIGICAVRPDHTFIAERLANRFGVQRIDLPVPELVQLGGIIIRNGASNGEPSKADILAISAAPIQADAIPSLCRERPRRTLSLPLRQHLFGRRVVAHEAVDNTSLAVILVDVWESLNTTVYQEVTEKIGKALCELRALRTLIIHAAHDHEIHPAVQPMPGEMVLGGELFDSGYLANALRDAGITHLLYMGYHSNMCVLTRAIGVLEMQKQGFHIVVGRDLSVANEANWFSESASLHRAMVHLFEINGMKTISFQELSTAIRTALDSKES